MKKIFSIVAAIAMILGMRGLDGAMAEASDGVHVYLPATDYDYRTVTKVKVEFFEIPKALALRLNAAVAANEKDANDQLVEFVKRVHGSGGNTDIFYEYLGQFGEDVSKLEEGVITFTMTTPSSQYFFTSDFRQRHLKRTLETVNKEAVQLKALVAQLRKSNDAQKAVIDGLNPYLREAVAFADRIQALDRQREEALTAQRKVEDDLATAADAKAAALGTALRKEQVLGKFRGKGDTKAASVGGGGNQKSKTGGSAGGSGGSGQRGDSKKPVISPSAASATNASSAESLSVVPSAKGSGSSTSTVPSGASGGGKGIKLRCTRTVKMFTVIAGVLVVATIYIVYTTCFPEEQYSTDGSCMDMLAARFNNLKFS